MNTAPLTSLLQLPPGQLRVAELAAICDALAHAADEELLASLPALERCLGAPLQTDGPFDGSWRARTERDGLIICARLLALAPRLIPLGRAPSLYALLSQPLRLDGAEDDRVFVLLQPQDDTQRSLRDALVLACLDHVASPATQRLAIALRYPALSASRLPDLIRATHDLSPHAASLLELATSAPTLLDQPDLPPLIWAAALPHLRMAWCASLTAPPPPRWLDAMLSAPSSPAELAALLNARASLGPHPAWPSLALSLLAAPSPALATIALDALASLPLRRDASPALTAARPALDRRARRRLDAIIASLHRAHPAPGASPGALSVAAQPPGSGLLSLIDPRQPPHAAPPLAQLPAAPPTMRQLALLSWPLLPPAPRRLPAGTSLAIHGWGARRSRLWLWLWCALPTALLWLPGHIFGWLVAWLIALLVIAALVSYRDAYSPAEVLAALRGGHPAHARLLECSQGVWLATLNGEDRHELYHLPEACSPETLIPVLFLPDIRHPLVVPVEVISLLELHQHSLRLPPIARLSGALLLLAGLSSLLFPFFACLLSS